MSAYPGLDADMLPLALIVVMLGGVGSLLGAFVGSFLIGAIYTFGTALLPDLAYVILFLPMIVVIAFRRRVFSDVNRYEVCGLDRARGGARRASPGGRRVLHQSHQPDFHRRDFRGQPQLAGRLRRPALVGPRFLARAGRLYLCLDVAQAGLAHWATAPAALLGTTLIACAFGWISLRATGLGFLMLTLALSQVLWGPRTAGSR